MERSPAALFAATPARGMDPAVGPARAEDRHRIWDWLASAAWRAFGHRSAAPPPTGQPLLPTFFESGAHVARRAEVPPGSSLTNPHQGENNMKELNETDQAAVSGGGMMGYPWDTPVPPPPGMLPGMPFCLLPTGLAPN